MKSLRWPGRIALLLTLFTWCYFLFLLPTFDFDESLYRRVAEEMKLSHDYWRMTWDGWPVYHKPPIFYWLICVVSFVIDGPQNGVSSLAARIPNFFATLGIMISLYWAGRKVGDGTDRSGWVPVLAFLCAAFPVLTATTVIFDPLQTLALMPALIIPTLLFLRKLELKPIHFAGWSLSLFFSCALKGLNGLVIPSIAIALQLLLSVKTDGIKNAFRLGFKFFLLVFIPASVLTSAFYFGLDHWLGRAFTHEFLWVQHFERSQIPMEEHSGSLLYHFIIIYFGAGFMAPLLLDRAVRTRVKLSEHAYPLSFALAFVLVFTASATKLPHYTWPVWPAFSIYFAILLSQSTGLPAPAFNDPSPKQRVLRVIAFLPVLILGMLLLALATQPELILQNFAKSPAAKSIALHFDGFTALEKLSFYAGALVCFVAQARRKSLSASVEISALFASVATLLLVLGIGRTAKDLLVTPFEEITAALKAHGAVAGDCIRSSGAQSPTFSLALGNTLSHNRCEPQDLKFLVAPEWKADECETRSLVRLEQKHYLVLCGKKP